MTSVERPVDPPPAPRRWARPPDWTSTNAAGGPNALETANADSTNPPAPETSDRARSQDDAATPTNAATPSGARTPNNADTRCTPTTPKTAEIPNAPTATNSGKTRDDTHTPNTLSAPNSGKAPNDTEGPNGAADPIGAKFPADREAAVVRLPPNVWRAADLSTVPYAGSDTRSPSGAARDRGPDTSNRAVDARALDIAEADTTPTVVSIARGRREVSAAERPTDGQLFIASRAQPRAFAELFERHFDAIHAYLARRAAPADAADLAAEVFQVAFVRRDRFDPTHASARPWLYGIAANLLRHHLRRGGREARARIRLASYEVRRPHDLDPIDDGIDAATRWPVVATALAQIPEADREALLLHAWEELTYPEVAVALGIPVGTVRSRIHRARRRLRELLSPDGQSSDNNRRTTEEETDG